MTTTATTPETAPRTCCGPTCCSEPAASTATQRAEPAVEEQIVERVREKYGQIATGTSGGCCGPAPCGVTSSEQAVALGIGYSAEELAVLPEGANLGLGCGAPLASLNLQAGETVLDLGSGAGVDAFIAARQVGPQGRVLGVDMTPAMLQRARDGAARLGLQHVEFREGRLEALPIADASVDAVTSNCVINLVPDKARVFAEIGRVLRPGGRLVISDIVLDAKLPERLEQDLLAYVGCVAGATLRETYFGYLRDAGLGNVEVLRDVDYLETVSAILPTEVQALLERAQVSMSDLAGTVRSVTFRATKG